MEEIFEKLVQMFIPMTGAIFGTVEFLKAALKLQGTIVTVVSFGVGVFFGILFFLAHLFPDWGPYVAGVIFIIDAGLVASGFYKFVSARTTRNDVNVVG